VEIIQMSTTDKWINKIGYIMQGNIIHPLKGMKHRNGMVWVNLESIPK